MRLYFMDLIVVNYILFTLLLWWIEYYLPRRLRGRIKEFIGLTGIFLLFWTGFELYNTCMNQMAY